MWCGVMWCDVVWCGVRENCSLRLSRSVADWITFVKANICDRLFHNMLWKYQHGSCYSAWMMSDYGIIFCRNNECFAIVRSIEGTTSLLSGYERCCELWRHFELTRSLTSNYDCTICKHVLSVPSFLCQFLLPTMEIVFKPLRLSKIWCNRCRLSPNLHLLSSQWVHNRMHLCGQDILHLAQDCETSILFCWANRKSPKFAVFVWKSSFT